MDFSAAPHYSVSSASDSGVDEEEEEEEEEDEDLSDEPTKAPKGKAKNEVPYLKRHLPKKCGWGNADQRGDDKDRYYLADRRTGSAKTDDSDGEISGKGSASARARHAVQTTDPTVHFAIVHLTSLQIGDKNSIEGAKALAALTLGLEIYCLSRRLRRRKPKRMLTQLTSIQIGDKNSAPS